MGRARRPLEALDRHVELIRWWRQNVHAPKFAEGFEQTHPVWLPAPLNDYLSSRLDRASTMYVTAHVADHLWRFAQEHDVEDVNLHAADLFLDNGYVWFEEPLLITDVRGRVVTIRAFAWFRDPDALRLFYFNDRDHALDELSALVKKGMADRGIDANPEPKTPLFHYENWPWDEPMFDRKIVGEHFDPENLTELVKRHDMAAQLRDAGATFVRADDKGGWYYTLNHEDPNILPTRSLTGDEYRYAIDPKTGALSAWFTTETLTRHRDDTMALNRFLLVLWQYMGEHLPATVVPDRQQRRAVGRLKLNIPGDVLVIDLRVTDPDPFYERPENPGLVHWSHRWESRGHWRRYRNKQTGEVVKTVWVRESVKGPDHLPLIRKDRVFHVHR